MSYVALPISCAVCVAALLITFYSRGGWQSNLQRPMLLAVARMLHDLAPDVEPASLVIQGLLHISVRLSALFTASCVAVGSFHSLCDVHDSRSM
jgi:hypothetical protein